MSSPSSSLCSRIVSLYSSTLHRLSARRRLASRHFVLDQRLLRDSGLRRLSMFVFISVVLLSLPPVWVLTSCGSTLAIVTAHSAIVPRFICADSSGCGRTYQADDSPASTAFSAFRAVDAHGLLINGRNHSRYATDSALDLGCHYTVYTNISNVTWPDDDGASIDVDTANRTVLTAPSCTLLNVHRGSLVCLAVLSVLSSFCLFALSFMLGSMWITRTRAGGDEQQERLREDGRGGDGGDSPPAAAPLLHNGSVPPSMRGLSSAESLSQPRWRADVLSRLWTACALLSALTTVAGLVVVVSVWCWLSSPELRPHQVGGMTGLHTALFAVYAIVVSAMMRVYYKDAVVELKALQLKDPTVCLSPLRTCCG